MYATWRGHLAWPAAASCKYLFTFFIFMFSFCLLNMLINFNFIEEVKFLLLQKASLNPGPLLDKSLNLITGNLITGRYT